jgi:hypothetical protein
MHTHHYERTHTNPTSMSIFEDWADKHVPRNTRTLTTMNARTQTLPLWASSKTKTTNSWDWRSHHMRLVVDWNTAYHWKHNTIKS